MEQEKLPEEKIKLDFIDKEYKYFRSACMFTPLQLEIFDYRTKDHKSIIETSFLVHKSESTVNKEIKKIKDKIRKVIRESY
jgi:hypothetical protein